MFERYGNASVFAGEGKVYPGPGKCVVDLDWVKKWVDGHAPLSQDDPIEHGDILVLDGEYLQCYPQAYRGQVEKVRLDAIG